MPKITIVHHDDLCKIAYPNNAMHHGKYCYSILGLYNYIDETIYILESLNLDTKYGESVVLHELVHHFQYESGEADKVDNINQLEHFAYFLEKKFSNQDSLIASNNRYDE